MKPFLLLLTCFFSLLSAAELTPLRTYKVIELNGETVQGPTIILNDKTMSVTGSTGVNQYFGKYTLQEGRLVISIRARTEMRRDDNLNKREVAFSNIISAPLEIKQTETGLLLTGANGNILLIADEPQSNVEPGQNDKQKNELSEPQPTPDGANSF